jgi:tetratricopeptide (TPR) repeat protein
LLLLLIVGTTGLILSWWWACDSYSAAIMTERLTALNPSIRRRPLPESVVLPNATWTHSTAQHLAHWAVYSVATGFGKNDRFSLNSSKLLDGALDAAPLNATARLARAELARKNADPKLATRGVGLSRDVLSLAFSARMLAAQGKRQAALELYRQALLIASRRRLTGQGIPRFNDDPGAPRYLLPGEENAREILRELVTSSEWAFDEWAELLPANSTVPLAAARLLRELGRSEAETLLDRMLADREPRAGAEPTSPLLLAARAEALAMRSRWREAEKQYRQAIELVENDTIRRSWWFNLADIAARLDDEGGQQAALRSALGATTSDDISRRATDLRRGARQRARPGRAGAPGNGST